MKSAIIGVGTELMLGQITDTNSVFISQELYHLGFDVLYHFCVGDNPGRLRKTVERSLEDCDLVVISGGLGPTQDDITKETVCEVFGRKLVCHDLYIKRYEEMYNRLDRKMSDNNKKMALLPENGVVFDNTAGMAPGFAIEQDGKIVVCLPGPPHEMKAVFKEGVQPYLSAKVDAVLFSRNIELFGRGESSVEDALQSLINEQTDPTIATYAKDTTVEVRVTSKRKTEDEARQAVDEMLENVRAILGDNIFSIEGEALWEVVCRKLLDKHVTVSCAESCTGGLFAAAVTNMPGISEVFDRGIVTYSPRAKMEELGVKAETIEKYGTVSHQTAEEMAAGLAKITGSRLTISVTGVAGPEPSENKPVGLYYIGICFDGHTFSKEYRHAGRSRAMTRTYIMLSMLDCVNRLLDGRELIDKL